MKKRGFEPGNELGSPMGRRAIARPNGSQVMSGTPRANDEDAFVPERSQCLPHVIMEDPISVSRNRQLAHRNVGVWVHQHERHPRTVVQPALSVLAHAAQPGRFQKLLHSLRQIRSPRCWIFQLLNATSSLGDVIE